MKRSSAALATAGLLALVVGGGWILLAWPRWASLGHRAAPETDRAASPPWTPAALRDLAGAIRGAAGEGLRPTDYRLREVEEAIAAGRVGPAADALADTAAAALAHDYAAGHVRNRHRFNWYIDDTGIDASTLAVRSRDARLHGRLAIWLDGLLPASAGYRALRDALRRTPAADAARRDRILANLERWRWLPRDFGQGDQLYVNLPTYRLDVISNGQVTGTYRAVIGATDMPTPALSATVRQVIANPDWIVPPSIVSRSHLRPGASSPYIFSIGPHGRPRVRQKPGPGNALGRVKIEFPNRLAIYFHDTPSRSLFDATARAFSHGCVRVQNIEALALAIVDRPDRLTTALAGDKTRSFAMARPWRATIVYLTLVPAADGSLADLGDPYHMDEPLAAALQGRTSRVPAPRPTLPVWHPLRAPPRKISTVRRDTPTNVVSPEPAGTNIDVAPPAMTNRL